MSGPLIALAPLITFLVRHRYPPLRVESGAAALLVLCVGAIAGCLMAYGGRLVRSLTLAGLVTLLVDLQTDLPGGIAPASFFSIAACTVFLLPTNLSYFDSDESLSNLLNFTSTARRRRFLRGGFQRPHLTRNAYFDALVARGYELHAYQSTYLDVCGPSMEGLKACSTYDLETIDSVRDLDVSRFEKLKLILITFSRQSEVLKDTLGFPWKLSTVSAMRSLDRVFEDIATRGRDGTAFFAHLVIPHQPYTFDRECAVVPRTSDWLMGKEVNLTPKRNSNASRAIRYPRYLEQVECVVGKLERFLDRLAQTGRLDGATLIIHGDHGSRISLEEPRDVTAMVESDYVDGYATLLAIKAHASKRGTTGACWLSSRCSPPSSDVGRSPPGWSGEAPRASSCARRILGACRLSRCPISRGRSSGPGSAPWAAHGSASTGPASSAGLNPALPLARDRLGWLVTCARRAASRAARGSA